MKIVHIQQYYNDGMGYQENIFPSYQADLGHEVFMITSNLSFSFKGIERQNYVANYENNGFEVRRIKARGEFKNRFVIFKNLYEELENIKPDYIYHHSATAPSLGVVCRYKKNNKKVFVAVDNHADLNISAKIKLWKYFYYNIFWKKHINAYDKYINVYFGVTPNRCLFLKEELGISEEKIKLLPIGADVKIEKSKITREKFCEKFNINSKNFLIVHGGKITPEKNFDRVIKAFKLIDNDSINLVLFGKINDQKVKKLISTDKRIINLDWLNREDTINILKFSDLGIWNTQHTTLIEDSIAVELPLILRYYGSTSHLIDNTGMFLYEGSTREIYDKLNFIINNKKILKQFKENYKNLKKILSYENIANESIEYMYDINDKAIHKKFMNIRYSDYECTNFRKI